MKRIVLFSTPTEKNINTLLDLIFPDSIKNKVFAYMPSDGSNSPQKYLEEWKMYAQKHEAEFRYIDNSKENSSDEIDKLRTSSILLITGGNTFTLLNNLRKSGLDKIIKELADRDEFIIAGFSAGAIVLTPTIEVCNVPGYDENFAGIKDLTGLNLVDFEVLPHYDESQNKDILNAYRAVAKHEVKEITDDGYLVIDI